MTETPLRDVGDLSAGIAKDIGKLGNQAGELLKIEIREQLAKALRTGLAFLPIVGGALVGFFLMGSALAYGISDGFGISLAASFGLVGGAILVGCGLGALALGRQARSLRLLPSETIEQLKEDLSWMTEARKSH